MSGLDQLPPRMQAKIRIGPEEYKGTPCWTWTGTINAGDKSGSGKGYGRVAYKGRNQLPHRLAYRLLKAEIPRGMEIDHLCRNRACCNPDHLEVVTHKQNMERSSHATKTHCKHGHEYTEETLRVQKIVRNGKTLYTRVCRMCQRKSSAQRNEKISARKKAGQS